jgi:hypothetical protein
MKLTVSLIAVKLICCDCVEVKVSIGNMPFPHRDSNGSNGPVSECPPVYKLGTVIIRLSSVQCP